MKKFEYKYQVDFRGTKKEIAQFEKWLTDNMISFEEMQAYDPYNDSDDDIPSGVMAIAKHRHIKTRVAPMDSTK